MRQLTWRAAGALLAAVVVASLSPATAQQAGGQGGQSGAGQGNAPLRNLVPRCIDLILAYPPDNSLIVRDPPVEDPNAPPVLLVKAQWLEVVRMGANNIVRKFRALDSPEASLTSGLLGEIKVKTPTQTVTYPIRVKLDAGEVVSMTLYSATEPGKVQYRLDKKEAVRLGDSYVVSGLISPQTDGQKETYLQFTFNLKPKNTDSSGKDDKKDGKQAGGAGANGGK